MLPRVCDVFVKPRNLEFTLFCGMLEPEADLPTPPRTWSHLSVHRVLLDECLAKHLSLRGAHHAVALSSGALVISDRVSHCCHVLDESSGWSTIGGLGAEPGCFHFPCGLAVHHAP